MSDLVSKKVSLSEFRGLAFVGGFSFADVLGSAKVCCCCCSVVVIVLSTVGWFLFL